MTDLMVTSHVGRDLLQSAQVFKREPHVIWEYVANSLQYVEPGVAPKIFVAIDDKAKTIEISDNGHGMTREGLSHFFTMHGENDERRAGRIGRGMFGTGKSAAFGIANSLTVSTRRDGRRNTVHLTRASIENATDGQAIPLRTSQDDSVEPGPNGTRILIEEVNLKRIDREAIVNLIEQRLATYPADVEVYVDSHRCTFKEPEASEELVVEADEQTAAIIGHVALYLRVSKSPLDAELRGVQVFSHSNWLSTTLAGAEGKEMSEYIFGRIDVPTLEEYAGPIPPYDNTRSGDLNPSNELVQALYRFVGPPIESLRRELVRRKRDAAKTEESRQLSQNAASIAALLNEDFREVERQLAQARSIAQGLGAGSRSLSPTADSSEEDGNWVEGGDTLSSPLTPEATKQEGSGDGGAPPELPRAVKPDDSGTTTGRPQGPNGTQHAPRGGFDVQYDNIGLDEHRSKYVPDKRQIIINLDHPQVSTAMDRANQIVTDPHFVRLSWDIAISEYAAALARLRDEAGNYAVVQDALFDLRETIDRLTRRAA